MYTQYRLARIIWLLIFYILLISSLIILLLRFLVFRPFDIVWTSMMPTYYSWDFVVAYTRNWEYERWDIVVLNPEVSDDELYTKRIIWLPLETLKILDGYVYIKSNDGKFEKLDEPYISNDTKTYSYTSEHIYELWDSEYFVMWDNRLDSLDSRECFSVCDGIWSHYVDKKHILWKIILNLSRYLRDNPNSNITKLLQKYF